MKEKTIALKVDVDTYAGTRDGVPALLADMERFGVRGTFYFSMGPDNSGKAIRRIFTRKGFLGKMLRTRAPAAYGIRTMLYGTLLPAPMIAASLPEVLRDTERRGHELGIHCWDHVKWHDYLPSFPNRDGALDSKGCIFCGGHGSGSHGIPRHLSITDQIEDGKEVMARKYKAQRFIAYFQAYSNTYAPVERLRRLFGEALAVPGVAGIIIATRPDCLPGNVLDYLAELNKQTYLWLETGLQSVHDKTLTLINRCHDHACSADAIERAKARGLRVCAHLILGLPGETGEDMMASVAEMNRLGVDGVKLHLLHVMKGTRLAEMCRGGEIELLDRDRYVGLVCDALERLDPRILIHRLTGDGGHDNLVGPLWSLKKFEVLNLIDSELERRGSRQGSKANPPPSKR